VDSIEWRKSTKSGNNGACVEVGQLDMDRIGLRDSKDLGRGPVLVFSRAAWRAFLDAAAAGEFDLQLIAH
jgi:hypothetical protein